MNINAIMWCIGMVLFACADAAIILLANNYSSPFSTIWWCATVLGGLAMSISLYCKTSFINKQKTLQNKYTVKQPTIAFSGNLLLMLILIKI